MSPEQRDAHQRMLQQLQSRIRTHECIDSDDGRSGRKIRPGITPEMVKTARRLQRQGLRPARIRARLHCGYTRMLQILQIIEAEDAHS
jgi:hypothetical protein